MRSTGQVRTASVLGNGYVYFLCILAKKLSLNFLNFASGYFFFFQSFEPYFN